MGSGYKTPDAQVQSLNATFAFGGGYTFEVGVILDQKTKERKFFYSYGPTIGFGLSFGGNVKEVRAVHGGSFNINDYKGYASGYTAGYVVGVEISGNKTNSKYQNSDLNPRGDNYNQFGYTSGIGVDLGLIWSRTYTDFFK